jgi:hypothetical protein
MLKETGARARIRAERCFGLESMVKGYQALYSRLAAHGGK